MGEYTEALDIKANGRAKPKGINSVLNGFRLLQALVDSGGAMGLTELSQQAGLSPAQAHAYLISLKHVDVVEQDETTGRYQLGQFALVLGLARLRSIEPLEQIFRRASHLAFETNYMIIVSVFATSSPVVVRVFNPPRHYLVASRVGHVPSMVETCTGRVFAAYLPQRETEGLLAAEFNALREQGFPTSYTPSSLNQEINAIRLRGYGIATGTPNKYLTSLSAPVFNSFGQLECVLTLTAAGKKISVAPESVDVKTLCDMARSLSEELGYQHQQFSSQHRGKPFADVGE